MMLRSRLLWCAGACALSFTLATASHAATIIIDDSVPGEITVTHSDFDYGSGGAVNGATVMPSGQTTVINELVVFTGSWVTTEIPLGVPQSGVAYIADPGQLTLARAQIDVVWSQVGPDAVEIQLTLTSFGYDPPLVPIPVGAGVPMEDGPVNITQAEFIDVVLPPGLTIQYIGDLYPDCPEPTLLLREPNQSNARFSDLDPSPERRESADSVMFTQDVIVQSLRWWGVYANAGTPQISIFDYELRIYEDDGGLPAPTPYVTYVLPDVLRNGTGRMGLTGFNSPEFVFSATLPTPIVFEANTTYWFALITDTYFDSTDNFAWLSGGDGTTTHAYRNPDIGTWSTFSRDRAFELCGFAPSAACPTDLSGDSMTNGADLAVLLAGWGACSPPMPLVAPTEPRAGSDMLTVTADDAGTVGGR